MLALIEKFFYDGKPKMTKKKLDLKIKKYQMTVFGDFLIFKSNFFLSFLVFHHKKIFLPKPTYFCHTKKVFFRLIVSHLSHHKIISLLNLVILGGKNSLFTPEKAPPPFTLKSYMIFD